MNDDTKEGIAAVSILLFIGLLVGILIYQGNKENKEVVIRQEQIQKNTKTIKITQNIPVYSLSINNDISGHLSGDSSGGFFLGIGSISGNIEGNIQQNAFYYFYKDNGDDGIILSKIEADATPLFKTIGQPHLEMIYSVTSVFRRETERKIVSQRLFVPMNYKLLGEFKK